MTVKQAGPPSEGDATNQEADATQEVDDHSSSSDEDSNVGEIEESVGTIDNVPELTLFDDDTPLLVQPAEEMGEADDPINETSMFYINIIIIIIVLFMLSIECK